MRACTAVITKIAYHAKKTIEADISFLSVYEWKQELGVLLRDLVNEDQNITSTKHLRDDALIAWQKVFCLEM
jgi:hypothetical protein